MQLSATLLFFLCALTPTTPNTLTGPHHNTSPSPPPGPARSPEQPLVTETQLHRPPTESRPAQTTQLRRSSRQTRTRSRLAPGIDFSLEYRTRGTRPSPRHHRQQRKTEKLRHTHLPAQRQLGSTPGSQRRARQMTISEMLTHTGPSLHSPVDRIISPGDRELGLFHSLAEWVNSLQQP